MHERAVWQAAAQRRTVGPSRRIHQDDATFAQRKALVGTGRGIALHARARGVAEPRFFEETAVMRDGTILPRSEI